MDKANKKILMGLAILFLMALLFVTVNNNSLNPFYQKGNKTAEQFLSEKEQLKSLDGDGDELSDYDEIYVYKTNPNDNDTDKDGYWDGLEVKNGYDPLMSHSLVVKEPVETEINISSGEYEIKGSSSFLVEKIELEITNARNEVKVISLDDFKKGDLEWSRKLKAAEGDLTEGKNVILVLAHQKDEIIKKEVIINIVSPDEEKTTKVKVDWEKEFIKIETEFEENDRYNTYDYYLAGKITNGRHGGQIVYLEVEHSMGDIFNYYLLKDGERFYLKDNDMEIEGLTDLPKTIAAPAEKYTIEGGNIKNRFFAEIEMEKKLFTHEKLGDIYLTKDGCAVAELPDHTVLAYSFTVPFINKENGLPEIVFDNGEENGEEYDYSKITGCGSLCYHLNVASEEDASLAERLEIVGKAGNGDAVYGFKDGNDNNLKDLYNDKNTVAYYGADWQKTDESKYSYEEFLDLRPLLYWQDALGRWVRFENKKFISAAEMCKPIIYLYPEEKTKIDVQVNPNGGFTFTEPAYNGGWSVEAYPDGEITDLKTGQKYDYLYWEGIGLNYPIKEEGFVVRAENLEQFFDDKLSLLGLNEKETGDFKNYWLKKLSADPYYKISFLTRDEFNGIAPLNFSIAKPRTIIRVMMSAEGLNKFKLVPEQKLPAASARNGFTAVEWGGTLLR